VLWKHRSAAALSMLLLLIVAIFSLGLWLEDEGGTYVPSRSPSSADGVDWEEHLMTRFDISSDFMKPVNISPQSSVVGTLCLGL